MSGSQEPYNPDDFPLSSPEYSLADRMAIRFVRYWIPDVEKGYIEFIEKLGGENIRDQYTLLRQVNTEIDGRVSGLLGHISIMIAICSIFAAELGILKFDKYRLDYFKIFIFIELILYILIAVLLMRCIQAIKYTRLHQSKHNEQKFMLIRTLRYFYAKRELYYICVTATTFLTISLVISILLNFLGMVV